MASDQFRRVQRRIDAIPKRVVAATVPALQAAGEQLATAIAEAAPKDTGALAASVAVTLPGKTTPAYSEGGAHTVPENAVAVTAGNSGVRYAHLVEWGTAKAAAQPFFFSTYHDLIARLRRGIKKSINVAVRKG